MNIQSTPLPLVSIITPSYNQVSYLEQTIQSVLAQDYSPIEYIIVDGASNDGSIETIRKYADQLAWWVSERDSGQAEAINKGFAKASGDIVAWLNSDDILLPGTISHAVNILQENPDLGMVFSNAITIDPEGKPLNKLIFEDWGLPEFMRFHIICQPAVFIRRSILEEVGYLDPSFHFMLDHHLWLRIASHYPVKHVSSLWAAARHHPDAKNVAQPEGFSHETLRLLEWMQSHPDLVEINRKSRRHILGGAYRLIARYYLDGGMAWKSLKYSSLALLYWPGYTIKHGHRMIFALLLLFNITAPARRIKSRKPHKDRERLIIELRQQYSKWFNSRNDHKPEKWPGLCLDI